MKLQLGRDGYLWVVWICVIALLWYIGEVRYYMTDLAHFLIIMATISLGQVGIFWFLYNRERQEGKEPWQK